MKIIEMRRLIADEGKMLTNGKCTAPVVDCFASESDKWSEIDDVNENQNDSKI